MSAPRLTIRIRGPYPGGQRLSCLDLAIGGQRYLWLAYDMVRREWMAITTLVGVPGGQRAGAEACICTSGRAAQDAAQEILGKFAAGNAAPPEAHP